MLYGRASRPPTLAQGARPGYAPRRASAIPSAHPFQAGEGPRGCSLRTPAEKGSTRGKATPSKTCAARPRKAPAGRGADTEPPPPPPTRAAVRPKPIRSDGSAHSAHAREGLRGRGKRAPQTGAGQSALAGLPQLDSRRRWWGGRAARSRRRLDARIRGCALRPLTVTAGAAVRADQSWRFALTRDPDEVRQAARPNPSARHGPPSRPGQRAPPILAPVASTAHVVLIRRVCLARRCRRSNGCLVPAPA